MIQHKMLTLVLLSAICLTLTPKIAFSDDFAPPPWPRGFSRAITAEWEFLTPANPLAPDGFTNVFTKGSGSVPTSATIAGPGGLGWGIGDGDGGWFFPGGGDIHFVIDNVIDLEPVKHIWMQVTHTPGIGLSVDPLAAVNVGATGSFPGGITMIPMSPIHTIFTWDMFPNPPFEEFKLLVFGPGEIDQVFIDTISVPEPSTYALYSAGLLCLGLVFRKKSVANVC